jgi:hypothetical protein
LRFRDTSEKKKKSQLFFLGIFLLLVVPGIIYSEWSSSKADESISKNLVRTIGQAKEIEYDRNLNNLYFTYYVDGELMEGKDVYVVDDNSRVRLSRPIIGQWYRVEYEASNHQNHRIVIGETPLNPFRFIDGSLKVEGCVQKQVNLNPYIDLYIDYTVQEKNYSFRTRLHRDSIQLYDSDACAKQTIAFAVSKEYPLINELYYLSRDRQYKGAYSTQGKWNY